MLHWRALCLAIGACLVAVAWGCGGSSSSSGQPPPNGNVLRYATPGEPDSLDPGGGISGFDSYYLRSIYDTLTVADPKTLDPTPGLATSWSFLGPDRLTFRLNLRHGVKFQDGTPFNAQAVKASMDHYRAQGKWLDLAPVGSETAVDDYTVDLNLKSPYAPLPAVLSGRAGMMISPTALQKYGGDFGKNPVGAGPFQFKSWQAGAQLDVRKFGAYWQAGKTHLAGITFKVIANANSTAAAVQAGQIDFAPFTSSPATILPALKANTNITTQVINTLGMAIVTTNNRVAPFNNPLVRRAVNMSVDRQVLSDTVNGKGVGLGPAWQYVPPGYWPYSKDLKNFPFDPGGQARQLLAQAGYPNGVTVQICNYDVNTSAVQIEERSMARAGITLKISQEPVNSCVAKLQQGTIPMVQIGWIGQATPYYTYQTMFGSAGTAGFGPYPGVDDLLARAAAAQSQQEQQGIYQQLNKVLYEQAPSIPLYYLVSVVGYSKRLTGLWSDKTGAWWINQASFGGSSA
jgi:peptide/nickel transport system substrate-binding protein